MSTYMHKCATVFYLIIYIILQKPSYSIHPVISCNILKNRFVLFLHIINMSLLCSCSFLCQPQLLCIWLSWIHIYCMHLKYSKVFLYAEGLAPSRQHKPIWSYYQKSSPMAKLVSFLLYLSRISFIKRAKEFIEYWENSRIFVVLRLK